MFSYIYQKLCASSVIVKIHLIHEIENGNHRLVYRDGKQGEWVSNQSIARLDDYGAAIGIEALPAVFKIEKMNYTRHYLNQDNDDYWLGK